MNTVQIIRNGEPFTNLLTNQQEKKISLYTVTTDDKVYSLTRTEVEALYRYYVRDGYNLSTQDLSIYFPLFTASDMVKIRMAFAYTFGLKKEDTIITPHETEEHDIEGIKDIIADFIRHKKILEYKSDLPSLLHKIIEDQSKEIDSLKDVRTLIEEGTKDIPFTPIMIPQIPSTKSLAIWLSDMHIGCRVTATGAVMQENVDWNNDKVIERLNKFLSVISTQGHFDDIWVFNLGDAIDGMGGTTSRRDVDLPQNMTNLEMAENYRKDINYLFDSLISNQLANSYHFRSVSQSNHGGDWEAAATEFLMYQLRQKGIDAYMSAPPFGFTRIQNTSIVYGHGKDSLYQQRPLGVALDSRTKSYIDSLLRTNGLAPQFGNILVVKGDSHQYNLSGCMDYNYLSVGSLFGSSEWAQSNFPTRGWEINFSIFDNGNVMHGSVRDNIPYSSDPHYN